MSPAARAVLAASALAIAGCDRVPPDAIRGPRKIVAGGGGVCALWDAAPTRCWGGTPYGDAPFARPSTPADVADVALAPPGSDGGCVIDRRGVLACTGGYAGNGRRVFPAIRSAALMRDVRAPALAGPRVCVIARAESDREETVWCRERESAPFESHLYGTPTPAEEGWRRLDLGDVARIALGPRWLCAGMRSGRVRCVLLPGTEAREVEGIEGAVQIGVGEDLGCARDAQGGVRCFGETAAPAVAIPLPGPATDLAVADRRACAIVDGAPYCWGLIRRTWWLPTVFAAKPERVADVDDLDQIALGHNFTCATRKADGTVRCWGYDARGALGDGSHLPQGSCRREGIDGNSAEQERPAGPAIVRTGDAGPHPAWRLPIAIVTAAAFLAPLAAAMALSGAALRRMRATSTAERFALRVLGLLVAILVPVALSRLFPGVLAAWDGRYGSLRFRAFEIARVALAAFGPVFVLAITTAGFVRVCRAPRDRLATTARRAAAQLVAGAGPLLLAAMLATPAVNEQAREELVYLVRDASLDLSVFFGLRALISWIWIVLAVAFALFTIPWARAAARVTRS